VRIKSGLERDPSPTRTVRPVVTEGPMTIRWDGIRLGGVYNRWPEWTGERPVREHPTVARPGKRVARLYHTRSRMCRPRPRSMT
jgi:hypothetical protein